MLFPCGLPDAGISPVRCIPLTPNTEVSKEHFADASLGEASRGCKGIPHLGDDEVKCVFTMDFPGGVTVLTAL